LRRDCRQSHDVGLLVAHPAADEERPLVELDDRLHVEALRLVGGDERARRALPQRVADRQEAAAEGPLVHSTGERARLRGHEFDESLARLGVQAREPVADQRTEAGPQRRRASRAERLLLVAEADGYLEVTAATWLGDRG